MKTTINNLTAGQNFKFEGKETVYTFSFYNGCFLAYCDKGADVTLGEFELLELGFDTYLTREMPDKAVIIDVIN